MGGLCDRRSGWVSEWGMGVRGSTQGRGAGLPMTSRYCCTTLLGSGPRKTYTSRIPPVDLQLRAGLGCRTTSAGGSPGLSDTHPSTPQGPRSLMGRWADHLWRGVLSHRQPGTSLLRAQGTPRTCWGPH